MTHFLQRSCRLRKKNNFNDKDLRNNHKKKKNTIRETLGVLVSIDYHHPFDFLTLWYWQENIFDAYCIRKVISYTFDKGRWPEALFELIDVSKCLWYSTKRFIEKRNICVIKFNYYLPAVLIRVVTPLVWKIVQFILKVQVTQEYYMHI